MLLCWGLILVRMVPSPRADTLLPVMYSMPDVTPSPEDITQFLDGAAAKHIGVFKDAMKADLAGVCTQLQLQAPDVLTNVRAYKVLTVEGMKDDIRASLTARSVSCRLPRRSRDPLIVYRKEVCLSMCAALETRPSTTASARSSVHSGRHTVSCSRRRLRRLPVRALRTPRVVAWRHHCSPIMAMCTLPVTPRRPRPGRVTLCCIITPHHLTIARAVRVHVADATAVIGAGCISTLTRVSSRSSRWVWNTNGNLRVSFKHEESAFPQIRRAVNQEQIIHAAVEVVENIR